MRLKLDDDVRDDILLRDFSETLTPAPSEWGKWSVNEWGKWSGVSKWSVNEYLSCDPFHFDPFHFLWPIPLSCDSFNDYLSFSQPYSTFSSKTFLRPIFLSRLIPPSKTYRPFFFLSHSTHSRPIPLSFFDLSMNIFLVTHSTFLWLIPLLSFTQPAHRDCPRLSLLQNTSPCPNHAPSWLCSEARWTTKSR